LTYYLCLGACDRRLHGRAISLRADVHGGGNGWRESLELLHPVWQHAQRRDDQEPLRRLLRLLLRLLRLLRLLVLVLLGDRRQERDDLQRLAEPHFVAQDGAYPLRALGQQPAHAPHLVLVQLHALQQRRRLSKHRAPRLRRVRRLHRVQLVDQRLHLGNARRFNANRI
jgi:hypothetical protein